MPYTVTCHRTIEDQLALICLRATDRNAVARASDEIDRWLKHNPLDVGYPFGANRCLTIGPLSAIYSVSPDDRMVNILDYAYTA